MALKATIFKAQLQIADMDRNHYTDHALTLARHPSETDERMMLRIVVFALHAHEHLEFGKGLSDPDEPDLWRKDLTGLIEEWLVLGQVDDKALIRACGRAREVFCYSYGNAASLWWESAKPKVERARNLKVRRLTTAADSSLATLARRNMQLHCSIQEGQIWIGDADTTITVDCVPLSS